MTYIRALAVAFTICAALAGLSGRADAQGLTLSGKVSLQTRAPLPRFTVRLYPPAATKRPTLVTYTDPAGNFKFTGLDGGRYLLELYQSAKTLVYQKVLTLDKNQPPPPLVITLKLQ
jgi:hypothetical protein